LRGAAAKGDTINANVGRDLRLESEQDVDDYHNQQLAVSASATIGAGVSVSASVNFSKTDSEYKSVVEQTGLWAGDGGFNIYVGNNTDLKGAVIASTADPSKNYLSTGTLSFSDIENSAEYKAISIGVSVGSGGGGSNVTPSVSLPQQDSEKSMTLAAISSGTIDIRDGAAQQERTGKSIEETLATLSRDPDAAHEALKKIFDAKKVQEQQELTRVFGEAAYQTVGDIAKHYTKPYEDAQLRRQNAENYLALKEKEAGNSLTPDERAMLDRMESGSNPYSVEFARNERAAAEQDIALYRDQYNTWRDGSTVKVALHGLVGAIQAGLGGGDAGFGALAAESGERLNTLVSDYLASHHPEMSQTERRSVQQLSAFVIGATAVALAGGDTMTAMAGGTTALQGESFNRRLHESEIALIEKNKKRFAQLLSER
jgi:filamentous hemagglutinin